MSPNDPVPWQPLLILRDQFHRNLAALRTRDAELADRLDQLSPTGECHFALRDQQIVLGRVIQGQIVPLPNPIPPAAARNAAGRVFPSGECTQPVLIAGLDQGWLWSFLYEMKSSSPRTPGHRHPLWLLAPDLERLWMVMHLHRWETFLADRRVRLFAGHDAAHQARQSMIDHPLVPWPRLSVTADPAAWPAGMNLDTILAAAREHGRCIVERVCGPDQSAEASSITQSLVEKLRHGRLRVLGITSLFTTFLQYSMRDWLQAFDESGHQTHLLIEQHDHELAGPVYFAQICEQYRPDLILMIDHYRAEFRGLPGDVPCVMWVQDRLPNIFGAQAGAAQQRLDYVLGYGRQECIVAHGYPAAQFMTAMVGFNPRRFAPRELIAEEREEYSCDVSFVSHAGRPADAIVHEEIEKANIPETKRFLGDVFDQLRGIYESGGFVSEIEPIAAIIRQSMQTCGIKTTDPGALLDFFVQKVNNALFRQQAIAWIADMDLKLLLYGRGWDSHPRFKRFARGQADNQKQLAAIYQCSAINLQVTPFGSVHQRLFDGLAAGGFFLLRSCSGDTCDRIYQQMWRWCEELRITSGEQFFREAPQHVRQMIEQIIRLTQIDPATIPDTFFLGLREAADAGFTRSASTLWPEYDRIAFGSRAQAQSMVRHFLESPEERHQIAASMRARVLDCMSYRAITRRLLDFIADGLQQHGQRLPLAA